MVVDMDGYSISQVAQRTGFPPTTLRFYEETGLVLPGRSPAGYRCYDDADIERLSFIGRAKGFGLSLDEITELLALLGEDECAPVQGRLRALVDAKIADAQAKVAELEAFTAELRRVAQALGTHTPAGPCDDACGCTTDEPATGRRLVFGQRQDRRADPVIGCTLSGREVGERLARWEATVTEAAGREPIAGGARLRFGRDVDIAALVALVAAEQDCCRFLTFTMTVASDGVVLDAVGPPDARPVIDALVGGAP
jgi:DNA-binding transcriptional MerR regulator